MDREIQISFLITHFNRFDNLEICIECIRNTKINFNYEIVISDDGSKKNICEKIVKLDVDQIVFSNKNYGLSHNINKGIRSCKGKFVFYCQDDFLINNESNFVEVFEESLSLLVREEVDLIRFRANYSFPHLIPLSKSVFRIPKFSFRNFLVNAFQYSDNPFLTRKSFFENFGYYLEKTSPDYGETEYAIRIFKSNAKIAIVNNGLIKDNDLSMSVIRIKSSKRIGAYNINKRIKKYLRALRLYFEVIFYRFSKRGLLTYKNKFDFKKC